jgi:GNAT superfamily N-acetyltransferase
VRLIPLQASLGGKLAGCARLSLPATDNTASAHLTVTVHPGLRRRGIGMALASAALARLPGDGRKVAIGRALAGTAGAQFAAAARAVRQQDELFSVLDLDRFDLAAALARLAATAGSAAGYSLTRFAGPAAPELRPAVAAMYEVMNDAPHESAAMEAEIWTAGRVAENDQFHAARGELVYTIIAISAAGQPAGLTSLAVRTGVDQAAQLDTAVAPGDRGRRLGYLMKTRMLEGLTAAEPAIRSIGTSNAASNEHMLAINAELGLVPAERWTFFERAV